MKDKDYTEESRRLTENKEKSKLDWDERIIEGLEKIAKEVNLFDQGKIGSPLEWFVSEEFVKKMKEVDPYDQKKMTKYSLQEFKSWIEREGEGNETMTSFLSDNVLSIQNGELLVDGKPTPDTLPIKRVFGFWKIEVTNTDLHTKLNLVHTKLSQWTNLLTKN